MKSKNVKWTKSIVFRKHKHTHTQKRRWQASQFNSPIFITHLMMMDPPSAGDDLGIPSSTVAHSHSAGLRQCTRRDGITWSRGAETRTNDLKWTGTITINWTSQAARNHTCRCTWGVFDDATGRSVKVSMNIDITWQSEGTRDEVNQLSFEGIYFLRWECVLEFIHYQPGGSVWRSSRSAAGPFLQWWGNSLSWWTRGTSQTCHKGMRGTLLVKYIQSTLNQNKVWICA